MTLDEWIGDILFEIYVTFLYVLYRFYQAVTGEVDMYPGTVSEDTWFELVIGTVLIVGAILYIVKTW